MNQKYLSDLWEYCDAPNTSYLSVGSRAVALAMLVAQAQYLGADKAIRADRTLKKRKK